MDSQLVAIADETLATIPFDRLEGPAAQDALIAISRATHGDCDVSMYKGFDPIVASRGEQDGSILRARFVALLRRRSDGAIRMVRQWAHDGFMETDTMVADGDRWTIEAAFSTHDVITRINVSALCHAYQRTDAAPADVEAHDAAVRREMAWQLRRIAGRAMGSSPAIDAERASLLEERIHHLEASLRSIAAMETRTHHVTDSVMRQLPTNCLSHYYVAQAVEDALAQSARLGARHDALAVRKDTAPTA
jgi:hypothetical protein